MRAERQKTSRSGTEYAARLRRAVVELAHRQQGVVALAQLIALGMSERMVRGWVASGRLQRIHHGVYAVGHRVLRREGYWMAAVLACGDGAVLSHRSAAALHDLAVSGTGRIDVTVPGRIGRSRSGIRVHCGDLLHPDERDAVNGIPCMSIARTILDQAGILDRRGLEKLCERAVHVGVFDLFALNRLRARHAGQRGVARLRNVLEEWDEDLARTRSELEVLFLRLVIEAGIERPLVNRLVEVGERTFEVDFHWPQARLVVETDGRCFHDNPLARKRDAERDELLSGAGWTVERFGWTNVTATPNSTLATVTSHLDGAATRTGRRTADYVP